MVSIRNLASFIAGLLILETGSLVSANPTPNPSTLLPRVDCTGVGPSPGGPPCGPGAVMQCDTLTWWSCPGGANGPVPPGTQCICNAFRSGDWVPNNAVLNTDSTQCTSGIVCVEGGAKFRVCGVSGLEAPQAVAPGTVCKDGGITFA